jgi:hypothetical protein
MPATSSVSKAGPTNKEVSMPKAKQFEAIAKADLPLDTPFSRFRLLAMSLDHHWFSLIDAGVKPKSLTR